MGSLQGRVGSNSELTSIEFIGIPFDGYGRRGHQSRAASVLRDAGLADAAAAGKLAMADLTGLPEAETSRGRQTGLVNEPQLLAMTTLLNERVQAATRDRRFPLVYGGDCSSLLGIVTGLRDRFGNVGLVFIDGHEDTMPLDVSEDGEAANTELGLLLGLTGRRLSGSLAGRLPALAPDALAIIGPRDREWRIQFNVGSLRDTGIWFASPADVRTDPAACASRAVDHVTATADRWWLHIDLDVLDPGEFSAHGVPDSPPEKGGLTWNELTVVTTTAIGDQGCVGLSVVIYDPDEDDELRDARRIVQFIGDVVR